MSVDPLAERGLDEALGCAISLWSIMSGESVLNIEGGAGVVRVNTTNGDTISGKQGVGGVGEGGSGMPPNFDPTAMKVFRGFCSVDCW